MVIPNSFGIFITTLLFCWIAIGTLILSVEPLTDAEVLTPFTITSPAFEEGTLNAPKKSTKILSPLLRKPTGEVVKLIFIEVLSSTMSEPSETFKF